jgi:hypothetical protein
MATQSRYQEQGFKLYRKGDSIYKGRSTYLVDSGTACHEDDGYDDTDALSIVKMLKDQIDQGQGAFFSESIGWTRSAGLQPVSQETHDKWLNQPTPIEEIDNPSHHRKPKKAEPKVDVTRTVPKVMPFNPPKPKPKKFTVAEDCEAVEKWLAIIESVDNLEIIRTPKSVMNIAKWIRDDEHANYRRKNPISCIQVREILQEFVK